MLLEEQRRELCVIGRRMVETGLVSGASGNISVRSDRYVAVSPAGVMLDRLTPEACPVVTVDGHLAEGERPSSETHMHLAVYQETGAQAVVHTHSTYGAVVATTLDELPAIHYNALLLGGTVLVAPYATYGTPELAENVRTAMKGKRAALMANHGGVTIGHGLEEAYENARLLEWLCGVYLRAKMIGEPRVLSEHQLLQVLERGMNPPDWPAEA
jgi:L-fuculose-phosphate aldolase